MVTGTAGAAVFGSAQTARGVGVPVRLGNRTHTAAAKGSEWRDCMGTATILSMLLILALMLGAGRLPAAAGTMAGGA